VEAHLNALRIRREGEAALRESEARFRAMADAAPVMVWVTEPDGTCTFLSRSWYEATGQTPETALGLGWLDAVHPDDRDRTRQTFLRANERHERFELEYRLRQESGDYRWAIDSARPRFDAEGGFLGYIGSVIDIDARKKAEEHRQLLVEELNHRVKNTLAIVQGLARQTFKGRQVPAEVRKVFEGRLAALAAAHGLLTRTNWQKAMLDELTDESMHACGPNRSRISFEGPAVVLEPKQAVTIALAFHELCTNAMKYGALSNDTGRISIAWQTLRAPEPKLSLVWRERDGPAVLPPKHRGFGLRMIEQALAQDLGGEVSMDFDKGGLVCTIHAALPQAGRPAP
jgi:PAS domain S-box-containing protein